MMKQRRITIGSAFVVFAALLCLAPILFMLSNSFMSELEIVNRYTSEVTPYNMLHSDGPLHYYEMSLLPSVITGTGYGNALLRNPTYLRLFWNSVLITLPIIIGQMLVSPIAAYGFENLRWKHKEKLYFLYIIIMLMPLQVLLVPNYIAAEAFHINGTYLAIILPSIFAPFGTFLIRQQIKGLDKSYIEAARVDGASEWRVFSQVLLPNLAPTMIALLVLTFAECWNIVDQAVVFISSAFDEPLSAYLSRIIRQDTGIVFAVSIVFMIPAFILFMIGQDNIAEGIALSGVK